MSAFARCPFCDEDHYHLERDGHEFYPWIIHSVDGRKACNFTMRFATKREALATWNFRAEPFRLAAGMCVHPSGVIGDEGGAPKCPLGVSEP